MDRKTTAIVLTVATALLCGCPGLFSVCFGGLTAMVSFIPGAEIDMAGSSDPAAAFGTGLVAMCVGVIFVVIPILIGVFMIRPALAAEKEADALADQGPLPPAI